MGWTNVENPTPLAMHPTGYITLSTQLRQPASRYPAQHHLSEMKTEILGWNWLTLAPRAAPAVTLQESGEKQQGKLAIVTYYTLSEFTGCNCKEF